MSTVTEDQHGMTEEASATETREVSQPSRTPGNNSVLSEPTRTLESKQLDGPLRSQSKSTKCNSKHLSVLKGAPVLNLIQIEGTMNHPMTLRHTL